MTEISKETIAHMKQLERTNDESLAPRLYATFLQEHQLADDVDSACTYQVYEDLRLIRKWTHVSVHVNNSKHKLYLRGIAPSQYDSVNPQRRTNQEHENDIVKEQYKQVIIPISSHDRLSPVRLQGLCDIHTQEAGGEEQRETRCITLAVVDDDSTTAYYRLFNQFKEIVHPQWKQKQDKTRNGDDTFTGTAEVANKMNNNKNANQQANNNNGDGDGSDDCEESDESE